MFIVMMLWGFGHREELLIWFRMDTEHGMLWFSLFVPIIFLLSQLKGTPSIQPPPMNHKKIKSNRKKKKEKKKTQNDSQFVSFLSVLFNIIKQNVFPNGSISLKR